MELDQVQIHILGIVAGLMRSYDLNLQQVAAQFEHSCSIDSKDWKPLIYKEMLSEDVQTSNPSEEYETISEEDSSEESPLYVSTRREFCMFLSKQVKICPKYSTCQDPVCKNFHVLEEYICPHVSKGNYCEQEGCELIVIKACRKGKRCNDPKCSFRH